MRASSAHGDPALLGNAATNRSAFDHQRRDARRADDRPYQTHRGLVAEVGVGFGRERVAKRSHQFRATGLLLAAAGDAIAASSSPRLDLDPDADEERVFLGRFQHRLRIATSCRVIPAAVRTAARFGRSMYREDRRVARDAARRRVGRPSSARACGPVVLGSGRGDLPARVVHFHANWHLRRQPSTSRATHGRSRALAPAKMPRVPTRLRESQRCEAPTHCRHESRRTVTGPAPGSLASGVPRPCRRRSARGGDRGCRLASLLTGRRARSHGCGRTQARRAFSGHRRTDRRDRRRPFCQAPARRLHISAKARNFEWLTVRPRGNGRRAPATRAGALSDVADCGAWPLTHD